MTFQFHQNWLSGFIAVGGRNLSFSMDFAKLMERANFDLTAEPLFVSSRQYLVMEYSILLSVTHVYQVCHRVIVGHCVKNVCSSSSLDCKSVVSSSPISPELNPTDYKIRRLVGWLAGA